MARRRSRARSALRRLRTGILPVPGQAAGLAAIVAVLAAALVSVSLMLGSAEEGTWERERARHAESALGATMHSFSLPRDAIPGGEGGEPSPTRFDRVGEFDDAVGEAAATAGLAPPVFQARLRSPLTTPTPGGVSRIQLLFRTGFEQHVDIIDGAISADGVLIPERLAAETALGVGDSLAADSQMGLSAVLPISGIYVEPTAPLPEFWAGQREVFLPKADPEKVDPVLPPPVLLAPRELALTTAAAVQEDVFLQWYIPLEEGIGVDEAHAAEVRFERLRRDLADADSTVFRLVWDEGFSQPVPGSVLPETLETVDETVDLLRPPVRAVGIGGAAAGVVLVGAWAGQRVRRRDDELRSLVARGISPGRIAVRGTGEAVLPLLVGAAAGATAARFLVRELGPSGRLPRETTELALIDLGIGIAASLVVVSVVTAMLASRLDRVDAGRATQRLFRVPWLPVTAAITVVTALPLVTDDGGPRRLDLLTLGVPLLMAAVAAGAITALLPRVGRRTDARLRRLPPAGSLALRRAITARGASRLVVVSTALALGLAVYAGALGDSSDRTIAAKSAVASPSDVVVPLVRRAVEDGPLPDGSSLVGTELGITLEPGDIEADLLVLDPDTFTSVAHWDDSLSGRPLDALIDAITEYDGDRLPVVVSGSLSEDVAPLGREFTLSFGRYYSLVVEVVGRADAFPGQQSHLPMMVADLNSVSAALTAAGRDPARVLERQVWATGEAGPVLDALVTAGFAYEESEIVAADEFTARPDVRAQAWSLAYLRGVSLAAGLLALIGIAMHALAQQRRRTVAALLLDRMGMSRRSADTATALEIGLLTGAAALVAVVVALPASALVLGLLDPVPTLLPDPLFTVPWGSLAVVLAGVVGVTVAGAWLVGRTARRTVAGEVLREAP
jgi:putative ABC transport system permease protein